MKPVLVVRVAVALNVVELVTPVQLLDDGQLTLLASLQARRDGDVLTTFDRRRLAS